MIRSDICSAAFLLIILGRPAAFAAAPASLAVARGSGGERRPEGLRSDWVLGKPPALIAPDLNVGPTIRVATNAQTDVTGTWNASFDTQIGRQDYTYQFEVKEGKLTGKASSANGESEIQNGKVEGSKVTFVEHLAYQGMILVITYSGTIVSRDEIRFTRQVGKFATEELIARRINP